MTPLADGLARKQRGMDAMECVDREWLRTAREYAKLVSLAMGTVTSDAIHRAVDQWDMPAPIKSQSYGCLFRGAHWMYMGMTPTTISTGHGRRISIWRWID